MSLEDNLFGFSEHLQINKYTTITISDFKRLFKDAFPNPTYEKLMNIDNGEKGYEEFFGELKQKGLLN